MKRFNILPINILVLLSVAILSSCTGSGNGADSVSDSDSIVQLSPQEQARQDSINAFLKRFPGDSLSHDASKEQILEYLEAHRETDKYNGGIFRTILENVPSYAARLVNNKKDKFIIVDKASLNVILYDCYGHKIISYGCAGSRNYGTKHTKGDSRTPEGFFHVQGKFDSTDWLFTDDNGYTSDKKGQFGPRFIRITRQIGIHGTGSPWSIGHRVSHGCIRLTNDDIMDLYPRVEKGMPVIILPGKKDRAVNREEGYYVPYFPTSEEYAMSDAEKNLKVNSEKKDFSKKDENKPADSAGIDSSLNSKSSGASQIVESSTNSSAFKTDSIN